MKRNSYFFYSQDKRLDDRRSLPNDRPQVPVGAASVAADTPFRYDDEEYALHTADDILNELGSPHTHALSKTRGVTLDYLLLALSELCASFSSVTVHKNTAARTTLFLSVHALLFSVATLVYHTAAAGLPVSILAEDGETPSLTLSVPYPSRTEEEAAAVFGLLKEARLPILTALCEKGGFSLSLVPGDSATEAHFLMPRSEGDILTLMAGVDPSLYAAFMLPLRRFTY